MRNKIAFVIGASVIAVCAVTAALLTFFKLREQWANQWYKRLGCAMLMGVAVCGTNAILIIIILIIGLHQITPYVHI
jgi:NO-binding membrane sensor protein with MHYT domain